MNSCPFSFSRRNGSICAEGHLKARTSFLDAFGSPFFSIRFTSLKDCEQFVPGPELFFVIMNFIHKTLCFSGCQNVRCVPGFADRWNRNFYSISVKNFHN